jgi:hypothetical protein
LAGGQYQPAGSFLELKGYVMNIDDMGDNTRLPQQRKPCHYWPDCDCGPSAKCWLMRPDDAAPIPGAAFAIVAAVTITIIAIFCGIAAVMSSALALIL